MSQQSTFWQLGLAVILIIGGLLACGPQTSQEAEIRIGLIIPLSGDLAPIIGQPTVDAARLTVQMVNDAGGLDVGGRKQKVVLIIEDNRDRPDGAVAAARKLIALENVVAIVGPRLSRNAIPAAKVAEESHIPMISPTSTNPETTAGKQYVFRASFIDPFQGRVMANFAIEEFGAQKAAVLYDVASDYNKGLPETFKQVFEEANGQVVAFETYTTGEQDFSRQLARIQDGEPEVLFLPNYPNEVPLQAQQARQMGIKAIIIGGDAWDAELFSRYSELDEAFFSTHWHPDMADKQAQAFIETYRQTYKREPNEKEALTFDAFGLIFQAIQNQRQADPESIRNGLYNLEQYRGITGIIEYEDSGDPVKSAAILLIKEGQSIMGWGYYEVLDKKPDGPTGQLLSTTIAGHCGLDWIYCLHSSQRGSQTISLRPARGCRHA